ncbi:hypothetical protein A1O3_04677 [Capronia epimyces CBS 606.96]|uniref:FMN hydroxy acid dehydrogenase domain-containing protein n=1 Tax=Capronia epimyces CBS 606.96 TaxID=1182542 RepID=W9Y2Z6_9EURO|nr:uncharacterized protein A1O3_04677 [Capronia epimyces CBS 606.96]EXJ84010.1 hypothetical protein A1O3_04677 [Capronia epimyces CBS 606.96]
MALRLPRLDKDVFTIQDLKERADKLLPVAVREFFNEGSMDLLTVRDNEQAYDRYKLRPRVMRDVGEVDTSTTIFNTKVRFPFGFSPAGMHQLAHPDGEIATSRAAAGNNIAMALSSYSTKPLEDVVAQGKGNPYGMHVCFFEDRRITLQIIRRAEAAGFKALFVSVDTQVLGLRLSEYRNALALPLGMTTPMLVDDEAGMGVDDEKSTAAQSDRLSFDPTLTWNETIPWLRKHTKLEIWLKGITCPEDVALAIDCGVDGVLISNHGGRQLDGVPASLDALRECAPVAKGRIRLAVDGGIRRGSDIFKALALGADFCMGGRIPLWGLAVS